MHKVIKYTSDARLCIATLGVKFVNAGGLKVKPVNNSV